jgi:hypothetical protein
MSYGPNFSDLLRGAADCVDKILRGQNRAAARSINPLSLRRKPRGEGSLSEGLSRCTVRPKYRLMVWGSR